MNIGIGELEASLVFLHGWMMSPAVFDRVRGGFEADFYDLSASRPALSVYVEEFFETFDKEPVTLVGHSMGGQMALYAAAHYPDRVASVVLVNPVPPGGFNMPLEILEWMKSSAENPGTQREILQQVCLCLEDDELERLVAVSSKIPPRDILESLEVWTTSDFRSELNAVRCPVTVIGTDDPAITMEILQQEIVSPIPHSRLVYLEGCGHYPQNERPDAFTACLSDILKTEHG